MSPVTKKTSVVDQVKIWVTPGLVSVVGLLMWSTITEIKQDVKTLLKQTAEDHVKIESLQFKVERIETKLWELHQNRVANNAVTPASQMFYLKPKALQIPVRREPVKITML
jgi:hypothetical protein